MTKEELGVRLEQHGLAHHQQAFEAYLRTCIRLRLTKSDELDIPIGASKMGGRPDLPDSISWPYETERPQNDRDRFFSQQPETKPLLPLSFVAQINLSEVSPLDDEHLLPDRGVIYFFYSAEQEVWGFDPRDLSGFKTLFYEGDESKLVRTDFPEGIPDYSRFGPCQIKATKELDLPSPWSEKAPGFLANEEEENAYNEACDDWPVNKMFGYPDLVQGEMELECELVTNEIYVGGPEGYQDSRRKSLEANVDNWRLLLQVDSNEDDCGMMWGDLGRIYYWIRKDDLLRRDFEKSWLILQCS